MASWAPDELFRITRNPAHAQNLNRMHTLLGCALPAVTTTAWPEGVRAVDLPAGSAEPGREHDTGLRPAAVRAQPRREGAMP